MDARVGIRVDVGRLITARFRTAGAMIVFSVLGLALVATAVVGGYVLLAGASRVLGAEVVVPPWLLKELALVWLVAPGSGVPLLVTLEHEIGPVFRDGPGDPGQFPMPVWRGVGRRL